jgi:hypothetical protein
LELARQAFRRISRRRAITTATREPTKPFGGAAQARSMFNGSSAGFSYFPFGVPTDRLVAYELQVR